MREASTQLVGVTAVEIVTEDQRLATLLVESAGSSFSAKVVDDPGWIVRFQPAAGTGADWAIDLLDRIERWLEPAPMQRAEARLGGEIYLFRPIRGLASLAE